jgi:hypothetical protein
LIALAALLALSGCSSSSSVYLYQGTSNVKLLVAGPHDAEEPRALWEGALERICEDPDSLVLVEDLIGRPVALELVPKGASIDAFTAPLPEGVDVAIRLREHPDDLTVERLSSDDASAASLWLSRRIEIGVVRRGEVLVDLDTVDGAIQEKRRKGALHAFLNGLVDEFPAVLLALQRYVASRLEGWRVVTTTHTPNEFKDDTELEAYFADCAWIYKLRYPR